MTERTLRIGVAGLGRAFTIMLPTFVADDRVELVAAADPRADARQRFSADFKAPVYETVEALCDDPNVEAIYVATPHQMHARHVELAAAKGKHILVEKPMAITLAECHAMVAAARAAGVYLIVGHSHSFNAPIRRTREIIASGAVGKIGMINAFNYTDFLYRPRRPEELVTEQGGGVIFSQAAHQIDIVRLLGGGFVRSVRAATGAWDRTRHTEGAYSTLLTFAHGAFASVTYSGYGHFDSDELVGWIGEMGLPKDQSRYGAARKALEAIDTPADEAALKNARNYGGSGAAVQPANPPGLLHQHFGFLVVSCEKADLRPLPNGVMIYDDAERRLEALTPPRIPRSDVIDEFYAALVHGQSPVHSGEWALATMEVCLAMLQSAREDRDVVLAHQIGLPQ
jgi:phthalate 4,5-cis-dihydrodiol dehydrogenase